MPREIIDYPFKMPPREHQLKCWRVSRDLEYFGLFLDMGTGKTKVTIDTATWLYDQGRIEGMLIVAPKGVYRNWLGSWDEERGCFFDGEVPKHIAEHVRYKGAWYDASGGRANEKRLEKFLLEQTPDFKIMAINVESLVTDRGYEMAENFLLSTRSLMAVDESNAIKNMAAIRTKRCIKLGRLAPYRRVLTGNPYANSPLDIYAPCQFLDPHALGFASYFTFKARFANLVDMRVGAGASTRTFKKIVGFRDLEELKRIVGKFSFTVRKDECLDLPPKIMLPPRRFQMGKKQAEAYRDMKKYSLAELDRQLSLLDGNEMSFEEFAALRKDDLTATTPSPEAARIASAEIVLTQLMRLQQIACGFVKTDEGEEVDLWEKENPRITAMLEAIEQTAGKVIIWAPFQRSINEIIAALEKVYGPDCCVRYDGTVNKTDDMETAKRRFQDPNDPARFFVANQQKGARGVTLTMAELMLYFANTYDNDLREQSEDRAHRDGLTHSVSYQDLRAEGTVDDKVAGNLAGKTSISQLMREGSWRSLFE